MKQYSQQSSICGVAALTIVILIGVSSLLFALSASNRGLAELEAGFVSSEGEAVFYVADSCMEEAYMRLLRDSAISSFSQTIGDGVCSVTLDDPPPPNDDRDISVHATIGSYNAGLISNVTITSMGNIEVNSWFKQ